MSVTQITTHVADAIARLMQQYKDKPNMVALITALVEEIQDAEDGIFPILEGRLLWDGTKTPAIGNQLDLIGEIVGLKRNNLTDPEYTLFLFATIAENNSDGTIPILKNIASFLFNPTTRIAIIEFRMAELAFEIYGSTVDPTLYALIFTILKLSVSGGVRIGYVSTCDATNAFRCDSVLNPILPTPSGCSTAASPTNGGKFATAIFEE